MHKLAVAVAAGVPIFELAIPCEVFGYERPGLTDWWYDFRLCAAPAPARPQDSPHPPHTALTPSPKPTPS